MCKVKDLVKNLALLVDSEVGGLFKAYGSQTPGKSLAMGSQECFKAAE